MASKKKKSTKPYNKISESERKAIKGAFKEGYRSENWLKTEAKKKEAAKKINSVLTPNGRQEGTYSRDFRTVKPGTTSNRNTSGGRQEGTYNKEARKAEPGKRPENPATRNNTENKPTENGPAGSSWQDKFTWFNQGNNRQGTSWQQNVVNFAQSRKNGSSSSGTGTKAAEETQRGPSQPDYSRAEKKGTSAIAGTVNAQWPGIRENQTREREKEKRTHEIGHEIMQAGMKNYSGRNALQERKPDMDAVRGQGMEISEALKGYDAGGETKPQGLFDFQKQRGITTGGANMLQGMQQQAAQSATVQPRRFGDGSYRDFVSGVMDADRDRIAAGFDAQKANEELRALQEQARSTAVQNVWDDKRFSDVYNFGENVIHNPQDRFAYNLNKGKRAATNEAYDNAYNWYNGNRGWTTDEKGHINFRQKTPEAYRENMKLEGARKNWEALWQMRELGMFGDRNDYSMLNGEQLEERKLQYESEAQKCRDAIGALETKLDEAQGIYAESSIPEISDEALASLKEGEAEDYEIERARENLNHYFETIPFDEMEDEEHDELIRAAYNFMNGAGAYQRKTEDMNAEEERAFLEEQKEKLFSGMDGTAQIRVEINNQKFSLRYYENELKNIDYQQKANERYRQAMEEGPEPGTTSYYWNKQYNEEKLIWALDNSSKNEAKAWLIADIINGGETGKLYTSLIEDNKALGNLGLELLSKDGELMMVGEEKKRFTQYVLAGQYDEALDFMKGLRDSGVLNRRARLQEEAAHEREAIQNPVWSSIRTVIVDTPAQIGEFLYQVAGRIAGDRETSDPYGKYYAVTRHKGDIRGTVSENIKSKVWRFLYNAGMSAGDSGMNMLIASCFGVSGMGLVGKQGVANISLGLFGSEAFQTSMQNALVETNGDYQTSFVWALVDTLLEEGTEIISIEALLSNPTNLWAYLGKNALAEGSEELFGSVLGPMIREMAFRKNEWYDLAAQVWHDGGYWKDGKFIKVSSADEAKRYAMIQWWNDIKESTLSGAVSATMGTAGGRQAIYQFQNRNAQIREGRNIQNYRSGQQSFVQNQQQEMQNRQAQGTQQENAPAQHQTGVQQILESVRNLNETVEDEDQQRQNNKLRQLAEEIRKKAESGVEPTTREIGRLSMGLKQALQQQRYEQTRNAIFEQMKEEGVTESRAQKLSELVARAYAQGEGKLSAIERGKIHNNTTANNMLEALTGRTQQTQETTEAARNAGQNAAEAAQAQTEAAGNAVQTAQNAVREGTQAQEQSAEAAGNVVDTVQNTVQEGAEAEEQNAEAIRQAGEMAERLKTRIAEATQETEQAMRSIAKVTFWNNAKVNEMMDNSEDPESINDSHLAYADDDYIANNDVRGERQAEGNRGREVVVGNEFARVDGITINDAEANRGDRVQFKVTTQDGNTRNVKLSEIKATNKGTAGILQQVALNPEMWLANTRENNEKGNPLRTSFANMLLGMQDQGRVSNVGTFLMEAQALRLAAYTEQAMPPVTMPAEMAQALYNESLNEHKALRAEELKFAQRVKPGHGRATLQGTEYGTKAFEQKMKDMGLNKTQRQQIHAIASFAQHTGIEVDFKTWEQIREFAEKDLNRGQNGKNRVEFTEKDARRIYGYQQNDDEYRGITINLDGIRREKISGTVGQNHMVVTFGHEMTHWLQQNSGKGYDQLRSFVLNELKNNGVNLSIEVQKVMEDRKLKNSYLTVEQAIDEIVADACDHIMASEEMANHLKETSPGLYNKVKSFVQALVAKIRNGIKGMTGAHYSDLSIAMMGRVNEMAKIWLGAYDEAISREYANAVIQQAEARPVSNFSMSAPIEYRADGLVAQHNLGVESLAKCIQMGGLWAPSTAVHNVGMRWNDFGEISAYLPVQFVDPQADTRNHLHRGDAYTPILRGYNVTNEAEAMKAFRQQADRMYTRGTSLRGLITSFVRVNSLEEARQKAQTPEQNNGRTELKSHWEAADKAEDALWAKIGEAVQEQDSWAEEDDYVAAFTTGITLGHEAILEAGEIGREQARALMRREIENEIRSQRERGLMVTEVTANELSDKLIDNMIDYAKEVDDSYQRPMQEAKPYRMVKFGELSALKIPNTLSEEMRQQLEDLGLSRDRMIEYDPKKKNGEVGSSQWADEMIPLTKQGVMFSMGEDMSVEHQNRVLEESGELTDAPAAYSLAGISAQGGYAEQVKRAMQMAEEGYDEDQIQSETGCVKGWKGRWWKLLDNGKMNLTWDPKGLIEGAQYKLSKIYDAEELYKAYPELADTWVKIKQMEGAIGATDGKAIMLNPALTKHGELAKASIESTLQHEIQHMIQYFEGSNNGASTTFWRDMQNVARARLATNDSYYTDILSRYGITQEDLDKYTFFGLEFNEDGSINNEIFEDDYIPQEFRDKVNNIDIIDADMLHNLQNDMQKWASILRDGLGPGTLYQNTVGEIEARAASRTGLEQYEPINYRNAVEAEKYASYSMSDLDQSYDKAAESGNLKEMEQLVQEAAERAMPESVMRDNNGWLKKYYHGTWNDMFYEFDPKMIGTAREGDTGFFGRGFYFAYTKGEASSYGGNVMDVFLNIKNPYNYTENLLTLNGQRGMSINGGNAVFVTRFAEEFPELANRHTVTVYEKGADGGKEISLKDFAKEFKKVVEEKKFNVEEINGEYGKEYLVTADKHQKQYTDENGKTHSWYEYGYQKRFLTEQDAKNQVENAYQYLKDVVYDHITIPNSVIVIMESPEFSDAVQKKGYDGIIQSQDGDEAVAFKSSQIKLADPETRDDQGNVIPLSERFNQKSNDTRYSMSDINAEYENAVKNGDTKTEQRLVEETAEIAMPNSKIRGKDGKLLKVYHGTNADFNEFDTSVAGGVNGIAEGYGIYLTDSSEVAQHYGSRQVTSFVDMQRPAYGDKKTIKATELTKLIKETCMQEAQRMCEEDPGYKLQDALRDTWISNYVYTYGFNNINDAFKAVANQILNQESNDANIVREVMGGMAIRDYVSAMDFYHNTLTPITGIDGIWEKWKSAADGTVANVFLAFRSSQIKMVDPETRDDQGKVIPIAERFNKGNNDIRYSMAGTDPETGRTVYISNFKQNTPQAEKSERLVSLIQNVWSKKPLQLKIKENGKIRKIEAKFDPDYDETSVRHTDAGKMAHPEFSGASKRRIMLNLADDYYDILQESRYDDSAPEKKDHEGVKQWHYFIDDIYYAEQGSDEAIPCTINIDIKEKDDGSYVYMYRPTAIEKGKTKKLSLMGISPVNTGKAGESASASENSIAQENQNGNTQFSMDAEHMDVNNWMMGLTPGSLQTEDERQLLEAYKGLRISISLSIKRQMDYNQELKKLQQKAELTEEDREQIRALNNKLEVQKQKQERLESKLFDITDSAGFAGMMHRQNRVLQDFVHGKTQQQVTEAVEDMSQEAEQLKQEIAELRSETERLAQTEAVKQLKSQMNKTSLPFAVKALMKEYQTQMGKAEMESRLAEMALKNAKGESIIDDAIQMARDMANNVRGLENETLERLRGMVIELGPGQLAEIKGKNMTLKDLKQQLKGTGITIKKSTSGLSTLENNSDELHELYPDMPDLGGEKDQIFNFIDWVKGMQQSTAGNNVYGYDMQDMTIKIMAMAGNITADITNDPAAKKIIDQLMNGRAIGKTQQMADRMAQLEERLDNIEFAGTKAKGWASVLQRDVTTAIDYYNKIAKIAAQEARERVKTGLIETLRSENTAKLIRQQQEYEGKIKDMKKANVLKADNEQLRRQIETNITRIYHWMSKETDQRNIPEQAKPLARALVEMIAKNELVGNRKVMYDPRSSIQDVMKTLRAWDQMDGPVDLNTALDFLIERDSEGNEDTTIRDQVMQDLIDIESGLQLYGNAEGRGLISLQDRKEGLKRVVNAVREIYNVITKIQQVEVAGRKMMALDMALQVRDDMAHSRFKGEWSGKAMKAEQRLVHYGNMTPEYFFKNLKNKAISQLHENFKQAENKSGLEAKKAQDAMAQIAQETGYENWDHKKKYTLELDMGGKVQLTTEQLMSLWATWQREVRNQMQEDNGPEKSYHLTQGGFYVPEKIESKNPLHREMPQLKAHRVTEGDMNRVKAMLTPEQHEYVNRVVGYLSNDMSELGNEASMRMYGIKKFKEAWYFPFRSWRGVLNERSDSGAGGRIENRSTHSSFTNRRIRNASNAIELGDFSTTAAEHIAQMISYNTVGPAVEFMNRVLNQQLTESQGDTQTKRNVRMAFQQAYGQEALNYLKTWMKDINGGVSVDTRTAMREWLLRVFKKNAVAGSMSVAFQQPLSYIRAAMMINPKYLAQAISPTYWKGSYQEMMDNSGVAVIKDMGRFDMGYGETMAQYIMPQAKKGRIRGAIDWMGEKSTMLPELMDNMTWTRIWSAVKIEQHKQNPEMDTKSPEFMKLVTDRFNDVIRKTQVYDSVMVKSSNMRSKNPIMKIETSFMAEPTLTLNILTDAIQNIKEPGGVKNAVKALTTFVLGAALQAAVKAKWGAGRSPDDDKTWLENLAYKFVQNFLDEINPANLYPGYADIESAIVEGKVTDNAYSVLGKATSIWNNIKKMWEGDDGAYRTVEDGLGQLLQLVSPVPVKNLMRDLRASATFWGEVTGGRSDLITGKPMYAQRDNSSAVLKYQTIDALHETGVMKMIKKIIGDAGYGTTNKDYYKRIAAATAEGQDEKAAEMTEYLTLGKGVKESTIEKEVQSAGKGDLETRIKNGDTSAEDARAELTKLKPEKSDDDIWFEVDRIEYERETGRSVSGGAKYYRFDDAMETNRTEEIRTQVKSLKDHGVPIEKIRDHIHDQYRDSYLDASGQEKIRIRDMIIKAYKETGLSEEAANKKVNSWKRKE